MRLQGGKCTCRTCTSPHKPLRDPNYTTKHLSPFTSLCLTLSSLTEAVPAFTSFYRICRMVIVLARLLPVFTSFCGVLNLLAKPLPAFMSFWGMPTALAETPAFHEHLCIYAHLSNTNCTYQTSTCLSVFPAHSLTNTTLCQTSTSLLRLLVNENSTSPAVSTFCKTTLVEPLPVTSSRCGDGRLCLRLRNLL